MNLTAAIVMYEEDHGVLPHSLGDLAELGAPYFKPTFLRDAWDEPMRYQLLSPENGEFEICSSGPNTSWEKSGGDDGCYSLSSGLTRRSR